MDLYYRIHTVKTDLHDVIGRPSVLEIHRNIEQVLQLRKAKLLRLNHRQTIKQCLFGVIPNNQSYFE